MRWIDKDKGRDREDADNVVKEFLDQCCRLPNGRYDNVRYDRRDPGHNTCFCGANSGEYRKRFTNILLRNQDGYCCYCLRKIKSSQVEDFSDEVVTREHIIPRGFTRVDAAKVNAYYRLSSELSAGKVILTDEFENPAHDQSPDLPPFPHKVSFSNIVLSCNGTFPYKRSDKGGKSKICCNEARKEKDAFPIYFIQDIDDLIEYQSTGSIQVKKVVNSDLQNKIENVIDAANLDCNELKIIRHLWFILSHIPKQRIYGCRTQSQRNLVLTEMLYKSQYFDENTPYIHESFLKDDFWNTFMLYDYFYDVYSREL